MALKVYIGSEIQDYKKNGSGDLLYGLQKVQHEWLSEIYRAYDPIGSHVASIRLRKLDIYGSLISIEYLTTNLISYDSATAQYLTDVTKNISLSNGLFEIEFLNSDGTTFTTEPFIVDSNVTTPWILVDGIWNDNGIWNDSKIWID